MRWRITPFNSRFRAIASLLVRRGGLRIAGAIRSSSVARARAAPRPRRCALAPERCIGGRPCWPPTTDHSARCQRRLSGLRWFLFGTLRINGGASGAVRHEDAGVFCWPALAGECDDVAHASPSVRNGVDGKAGESGARLGAISCDRLGEFVDRRQMSCIGFSVLVDGGKNRIGTNGRCYRNGRRRGGDGRCRHGGLSKKAAAWGNRRRVCGWRAMHAISLGLVDYRPSWFGLEPGRKFAASPRLDFLLHR